VPIAQRLPNHQDVASYEVKRKRPERRLLKSFELIVVFLCQKHP
jgi:hypothetical protein